MHVAIAVMGFSFGLATTLSITIVVDMTTAGAHGTANSLRIMANRAGQFVMPFGAGLVAAAAGLGGLFVLLAAAIAGAAGAMAWKQPKAGGARVLVGQPSRARQRARRVPQIMPASAQPSTRSASGPRNVMRAE